MEISLNLRAEDLTSEGCRLTRGHLVIGIQLRQKPFPFMPPRGKGEGNSWGCWGSVGLVYVCLACVVSVRLRIWRLASGNSHLQLVAPAIHFFCDTSKFLKKAN
jgi:hypothetical protein